ncbi:TNF receptor-associated factor 5-like [Saccostrea cucullata]|uniref:TNF receptor-associated factor 5-like n=1 Tax=Saccostrea cuccullata TaxID=36930 RepID=UPI002ED1DC71
MGLETKLFEGDVDESFICKLCHKVFLNPVSSSCKHLFCNNCIQKRFQYETLKHCPICKTKFTDKLTQPSNEFKLKLLQLRIMCSNKCGKVVLLGELPDHVSDMCPHTPVTCPFYGKGCRKKIRRCDIKRHLKECDFREVVCEACGYTTIFRDLFTHQSRTKCLEKKLKQQIIREFRHTNREVRRHKSLLNRQHVKRDILLRQKELEHSRNLQSSRLSSSRRFGSLESLANSNTSTSVFLTENVLQKCFKGGQGQSGSSLVSDSTSVGSRAPLPSRSGHNVFECMRCKKLFKPQYNHEGACRWHQGPVSIFFSICNSVRLCPMQ